MQWIVIHSEHTKECIVIFGDGTTRPVFVQGADLKFFVTATKLHVSSPPFLYLVLFQQLSSNHQPLNLAGTLAHQHKGRIAIVALDIEFLGVTEATVYTQCIQRDLLTHL